MTNLIVFTYHYTSTAVNTNTVMHEWIIHYQLMWVNSSCNISILGVGIKGNPHPKIQLTVFHRLSINISIDTKKNTVYPSRSTRRWHSPFCKMFDKRWREKNWRKNWQKWRKWVSFIKKKKLKKIKKHDAGKAPCTYYLLYRFWGCFIAL